MFVDGASGIDERRVTDLWRLFEDPRRDVDEVCHLVVLAVLLDLYAADLRSARDQLRATATVEVVRSHRLGAVELAREAGHIAPRRAPR